MWTVRGASFSLWALVAASAVYWALKVGGRGAAVNVPAPPPRPVAPADPMAIARVLGSTPAAAAAPGAVAPLASRFQLVGVAAGAASGGGAALIAVDGKPARPFRVGSVIEEGVVLHSVQGRQAVLAQGSVLVTLELPRPAQTPMAAPR